MPSLCSSRAALVAALTLAPAAVSQAPIATSPSGFLTTNGGSGTFVYGQLFGALNTDVFQVDNTARSPLTITALHLRRDAHASASPFSGAATVQMRVRMGLGDWTKVVAAPATTSFDDVAGGTWVEVVQPRAVSVPDLSQPSATTPAPWSLRLPLDTPFQHNGTSALCIQLQVWATGPTETHYPFDTADSTSVTVTGQPLGVGSGCVVPGGTELTVTGSYTVPNTGSAAAISITMTPQVLGPGSISAVALIGLSNPMLSLPDFCAPLMSSGEIVLPLPTTILGGSGGMTGTARFPHRPSLVGVGDFYVQAWTADASQAPLPIAGSHGFQLDPIPARPQMLSVGLSVNQYPGSSPYYSAGSITTGTGLVIGLE